MKTKIPLLITGLAAGIFVTFIYYHFYGGPPESKNFSSGHFGKGRSFVTHGEYDRGLKYLTTYDSRFPRGRNSARAGLFTGKAYLAKGNLKNARIAWRKVIKKHPETLEAHKCRYKMGLTYLIDGNNREALKFFKEVVSRKNGPLVPEAEAMLTFIRDLENLKSDCRRK